jgi:hypothetical protein
VDKVSIKITRNSDTLPICLSYIITPGPHPTTESYNASVVKIYNATSSLVRFKNKYIYFDFEKNALAYDNAAVVCSCKLGSRSIDSSFVESAPDPHPPLTGGRR